MQLKHLIPATLLGAVAAQQVPNLTSLLGSTPSLANLTTFVSQFPQLLETLSSASNITILAPTNEAFTSLLTSGTGAALQQNPGLIQAVLQYHVLNGTYPASAVTDSIQFLPTLLTNTSYSNVTGGQVVGVEREDDNVVFYSALLQESRVTQADVNFTGGVVHIIDRVLSPPQRVSETALGANLTSLAGALNATGLIETVDGLSDITVFAPDNDAFQAIGSALPSLSTDALTSILTYHVINGTVAYSNTLTNSSIPTVNGANVTITIVDGDVWVNSARVTRTDILVSGGVLHIIDNVLNPNNTAGPSNPDADDGTPAFSGASSATAPPFTSGISAPTSALQSPNPSAAATTTTGAAVSTGGAEPMVHGAMGAAALFGGAAMLLNI